MRFLILMLAIIASTFQLPAKDIEPLEIAKKIFSKEKFPELKKHIMDEYKGKPDGSDFPNNVSMTFKTLEQKEYSAVINLTISDSIGKGFDAYLYFAKISNWKMRAFRCLSQTGLIANMVNQLENMNEQQIDEMIKKTSKSSTDLSPFKSREDFKFTLGNSKLILELDEKIIKHFNDNKEEFERLKNLAIKESDKLNKNEYGSSNLLDNIKEDYRKLFVSKVFTNSVEFKSSITFMIGGIMDNSVGYIYVRKKEDLPKMSPNEIIMLREISNGWYVYKTT